MMPVPMAMVVTVSLGGWVQVEFGRGPAEDVLQPAAYQGDGRQQTGRSQLPVEVGNGREAQAATVARHNLGPDVRRHDDDEHERHPGAVCEVAPAALPVDGQ